MVFVGDVLDGGIDGWVVFFGVGWLLVVVLVVVVGVGVGDG